MRCRAENRITDASFQYYLEVLTAQQSLLEAEVQQLQTRFERIQSVIKLYHALGGGRF